MGLPDSRLSSLTRRDGSRESVKNSRLASIHGSLVKYVSQYLCANDEGQKAGTSGQCYRAPVKFMACLVNNKSTSGALQHSWAFGHFFQLSHQVRSKTTTSSELKYME